MKIKLGALITEAKGKIGGHYVGSSRWGNTIAGKRSRSGQAQSARPNNGRLIQFYSHKWNTISADNQKTWISYYGSKLKGFKAYLSNCMYREFTGSTVFDNVIPTQPTGVLSFNGFTYTEATQTLTITLGTDGTTVGQRLIQIRNHSPMRSVVGHSGWLNLRTQSATVATPINISTAMTNMGKRVTNQTTFQLRVVQTNNNRHPAIIMQPVTIQTGA